MLLLVYWPRVWEIVGSCPRGVGWGGGVVGSCPGGGGVKPITLQLVFAVSLLNTQR